MPAKRKGFDFPLVISFGVGRVSICLRSNGFFKLAWREMGAQRTTTKTTQQKAIAWAEEKARHLDAATGQRWVHAGDADALEALRRLAGDGEGALRRLVADVGGARGWLDAGSDLTTAARYYAESGMMTVQRTTLAAAVARFLAEYDSGSKETRRTFGQELESFAEHPSQRGMMLMDLDATKLSAWTNRKVNLGKDLAAARTVDNRMTTWITFLNRCRDWKLLPETGKHAGDLLRRPSLPEAGKTIFSVSQGRQLLEVVRAHDRSTPRQGKRLEAYLLIGGWLGLRPSEIQRLTWSAFEWDNHYCHVTPEVARKNKSERYIPMDARLSERLHVLFLESGKKVSARCCAFRCREFLSVLARETGVCEEWPSDVLRHSFCSYRIAVVKSLEQVATEADNSPGILKSNYRRPLKHEDGVAWWDLLERE